MSIPDEESLDSLSTPSTERSPLLGPDTLSDNASTLSNQESLIPKSAGHAIDDDVQPETSTLGRKIGWSSAYILVISRVIGSGIFAMPGVIVQNVGSPGLALTIWVAGALVAWAGLVISMEYGAMLPRSGGVKVYLEYTYRWPRFFASVMVSTQAVLLGFTATNCIIFAKYILYAANREPTDLATKTLAVGLLSVITIIHGGFYRSGIWIQNALGWLKIGLTIFMIIIGFVVLFREHSPEPVLDNLWKDSNWEWNTLSTTLFKALYSFAGLENVNNVMNEVKNPIRTIKTVGPAALMSTLILYLLINWAYLAVVPLDEIKQSRELIAALFFEKLGFGRAFLPVAIALSAAGNVMVVTFSLARLNQEVARQGFLPFQRLLASNEPFGSPLGGLIVHYIPSIIVIALPPSGSVYSFIVDVEAYAGQFFGLAVAIGLILLRYRKPDLKRPFKAWLPAVWLRIALGLSLILVPLIPPKDGHSDVDFFYAAYALVGLGVLFVGVLYWFGMVVAWPRYRGYVLEEQYSELKDGTSITKLVRKRVRKPA